MLSTKGHKHRDTSATYRHSAAKHKHSLSLSHSLFFHSTRSSDFAAFTRRKSFTPRLRLRFFYPAPCTRCLGLVHRPSINATIEGFTLLELDLSLSPERCIFSAGTAINLRRASRETTSQNARLRLLLMLSPRERQGDLYQGESKFDTSDSKRHLSDLLYIRVAFYRFPETSANMLLYFGLLKKNYVPQYFFCKFAVQNFVNGTLECNKMYLPKNT